MIVACLAAGGCASTPPIPNPTGLPPDALRLEYVLGRGCLPYVLGHLSEDEAMRGVGLTRIRPIIPGLMPGDNAPFWSGGVALRVNVGGGVCNTALHGRNVDAYRAATEAALHRGLGADPATDGRTAYKAILPGQVTGCHQAIRYTFYPEPKWHGFSVELYRVPDCAHDLMRARG